MAAPEKWSGSSPSAWIDDIGHAIAERYREIEEALHARLSEIADQHADSPADIVARHRAIKELREQAEQLVKTVNPDDLAKWATAEAAMGASAEISRLLLDFPAYPSGGVSALTSGGGYAVAAVELDLRDALRALNQRILRAPVDAYQAMTSKHVTSLLTGMTTSQALHRRILDEYIADGITGFTDKSGRRWTIGAYSEMATRTAAARAWRDQSVVSMETHGINTFTPVIGVSACTPCGQWAGKIITKTGAAGTITVPHAITAAPTQIHVDGTLEDMRSSGWGHPNCRCVLIPGLPGGTDPTKYSTHNPQAEADREKLRELEREVRQAKRDGDADAIGEAQAELRAHVAETGITRRPYREQLPFADGGETNPLGRTKPTPPVLPRESKTWEQRHRRLGFPSGPQWEQEQHEILFYERFTDAGNSVRLIPKSLIGKPTNDFRWLNQLDLEIEVKSTGNKYSKIADRINGAVKSSWENHQVAKTNFIVDLGDQPAPDHLVRKLSAYNDQRAPERQIERLWLFTQGSLIDIPLRTKK